MPQELYPRCDIEAQGGHRISFLMLYNMKEEHKMVSSSFLLGPTDSCILILQEII